MKTLTVRLPEALAEQIAAESRRRRVSKSDIVRERLEGGGDRAAGTGALDALGDLIGSIDSLPADLSARKKHYLKASAYGRKRPR